MKPILFNTEMALALLAGRKTQTRRVVKPQPAGDGSAPEPLETRPGAWNAWGDDNVLWPAYQPGDVLWVRETWSTRESDQCHAQPRNGEKCPYESCELPDGHCFPKEYIYKATDSLPEYGGKWRPSIHMPKEAARLFLRVTDVRVERLQDITVNDLQFEGIVPAGYLSQYAVMTEADGWLDHFKALWDSTIKPTDLYRYGWNANPWVWVYTFERITREEAEAAMKEAGG